MRKASYTRLCPGSRKANEVGLARGSDFGVALVRTTRHAKARIKDRGISHLEVEKLVSSKLACKGEHGSGRITNGQLTVVVADLGVAQPRVVTAFRQNQSIFNLQQKNHHMAARCASAEAAALGEPEFYPAGAGAATGMSVATGASAGAGGAELAAAPRAMHVVPQRSTATLPNLQGTVPNNTRASGPMSSASARQAGGARRGRRAKGGRRSRPLFGDGGGHMGSVYAEYRRHGTAAAP